MALRGFSRVNDLVLVKPSIDDGSPVIEGHLSSQASAGATPKTILFLSWGDADARHIEKYTSMYTTHFPGARIVLVRGGVADFLYRSERTQRKLVEPAVRIISELAEETLLVHVMSNAGSKQWSTVNKLYLKATGRALSNAVTILDSAPGRWRLEQTWTALSRSLPRAFLPRITLSIVFGIILSMIHLGSYILPGPDVLEAVREQMNNPTTTAKGTRRCYIYSKEDDIIGEEDVEEHARDAEQKGWAVELVKFHGSTHVGHFRQAPEKYREAIDRTWFGRSE